MKFQIPKGLFDIVPYGTNQNWQLTKNWHYLEKVIREITYQYGYSELRTPIFEQKELFYKSIGQETDVVSKEMYEFKDKASREMALRPEGTAGIVRSFIEKNLYQIKPLHKLYYIGPMFRYDRPQAGRYRQHHQFGIEILGVKNYLQDLEAIEMLYSLYTRLKIKDVLLNINCLGNTKTQKTYTEFLRNFLKPHFNNLSLTSQHRFEKNVLRILDSKEEQDIEIINKAPSILEFLDDSSKNTFNNITDLLQQSKIPYEINPLLVRGLDYYNDVVFEFTTQRESRQNSLGGGGRYDNLISNFSGPNVSGIGFGTGIERILQEMEHQTLFEDKKDSIFVYFVPLNLQAEKLSFLLCNELRKNNIPSDICTHTKKIQKALKEANKELYNYAAIIGEDEITNNVITLKDLYNKTQIDIPLNNFIQTLSKLWKK